MSVIEMKSDVVNKIREICQDAIGKQPIRMEVKPKSIQLEFDTVLSDPEKQTLSDAMPEYIKKFWTFIET